MPKSESFVREEILQKIIAVFWDKGYHGTSMQDIVEASGLNRSSIYNSFGDKHQLFLEALKEYQKQSHDFSLSLLKSKQSPRQIIKSILESGTVRPTENSKKGCLLVNCTSEVNEDQAVKEFMTDNLNVMVSFLTELVREGQRLGEFGKSHGPDSLALYFFSALQGLKNTSLLVDNQKDIGEVIEMILSKD